MSYDQALAEVMFEYGKLAEEPEFYGGYRQYNDHGLYTHMAPKDRKSWQMQLGTPKCGGWLKLTDVREDHAYGFTDTFHDSEQKHFVKGKVTCRCKRIKEKNVYYDGTFSDLLRATLSFDLESFSGYSYEKDK